MSALRSNRCLLPALIFLVVSCVEPYAPPEISGNPDYLVVDGFLNASTNSCNVRLSRAVSISSELGFAEIEEDAGTPIEVALEDEQGNRYLLNRISRGVYERNVLPLDLVKKYRLSVHIPPSENYESDFVEVKQTPAIEKIFFEPKEDALSILLNTAEASGQTNHYRWSWEETYEYTSAFYSMFKLVNGEAIVRKPEEEIYRCYASDFSDKILVASSTELNSDVIKNFELQKIPRSSQKLQHRYSINVKQMALTEDAYTYWYNLYKTTEHVGGLFDPMPGEVSGNFRSTSNPTATVIGYFSASTVEEQRIFITPQDLPDNYSQFRHRFCDADTILNEDLPMVDPSALLTTPVYSQGFPVIIGYLTALDICVDCRDSNGGGTEKPSFWP